MRVKVAITTRIVDAPSYAEPRDALSHDWTRYLAALGAIPVLVPNTLSDPGAYLLEVGVDALILSNGDDVAAAVTAASGGNRDEWPLRDRTEWSLMSAACDYRLPVLGVCRGLQFINAFFGGRLCEALAERPEVTERHVATQHAVTLGPYLADALGRRQLDVNSYHRQGVLEAELAPGLEPLAVAGGGVVEACRHEKLPIWALQWHPERPGPAVVEDHRLMSRWLAGLSPSEASSR